AADDWLGNTGRNTTYSVMSAERDTTSCESGPAGGSEGSADPEPGVFGSLEQKRKLLPDNHKKWWIIVMK
ncbi:hypothetical protein U9Z80_24945, partial [Escherichia coli]|uniref:hypothetical protein n=6 Tax=Escherichia coli TaxID=562 RepID=UPI002FBD6F3E